MSLLQALLQDPVPGEVFIALRTDGVFGSGTENDPWSGATMATSSVAITLFVIGSPVVGTNLTTVTVTTALPHNLKTGDIVKIEGTNDYRFNASFPVTYQSDTEFTCTIWNIPGASAPAGAPTCRKDPYLFDVVMRKIQQANVPVRIRIGPGVFETKGYGAAADQVSWRPISGMKIAGSGLAETTLKLVGAYFNGRTWYAIGTLPVLGSTGVVYSRIDDFGLSDMTLDCDQLHQPSTDVTCGGVFIRGNRALIRNVRVVNFARGSLAEECFPIAVAGPSYESLPASSEAIDCVVENCIAESPSPLGVVEMICINTVSGAVIQGLNSGLAPFPIATQIRGCYVDCDYQRNPVAVSSLVATLSGATVDVTTVGPHQIAAGDWVRITGVRVNSGAGVNQFNNLFNGSFKVAASPAPTATTFSYVVSATPSVLPLAGVPMWVGRWPSHRVQVTSVSVTKDPVLPKWTLTVVTATPHFLVEVETTNPATRQSRVILNGLLRKAGVLASPVNAQPLWLLAWDNNKQFRLETTIDPSPGDTGTYFLQITNLAVLGIVFQGVAVAGGRSAVVEDCHILNCAHGGPYNDTGTTGDFICRNNFYSGVVTGPNQSLQSVSVPSTVAFAYTVAADLVTVTFSYPAGSEPHNLSVGQGVLISGVRNSAGSAEAPAGAYNGTYLVESIPDPRSFTYKMATAPGFAPGPGTAPTVQSLWETRNSVIENNVIEILPSLPGRVSVAISQAGYLPNLSNFAANQSKFSIFRNVSIRNNIIRYVSSVPVAQPGDPARDVAIQVLMPEQATIALNVVDLTYHLDGRQVADPIRHRDGKAVYYFQNTDASGRLIQGLALNVPTVGVNSRVQETSTTVDDAFALALL